MFKRLCSLLMCLAIILLALPKCNAIAQTEKLLVIYQPSQAFTQLSRLITYMGKDCDYRLPEEVRLNPEYQGVIICMDDDGVLPSAAVEVVLSLSSVFVIGSGGLSAILPGSTRLSGNVVAAYTFSDDRDAHWMAHRDILDVLPPDAEAISGSLLCEGKNYPLCAKLGNVTHLAYFDPESFSMCGLLSTLITDWLWPYEGLPHQYGSYLVIDQVYPFDDPNKLLSVVEMLQKRKLPYAISVMPFYDNGDYPSVMQFIDVLAYAQSLGAAIIMHAPLIDAATVTPESYFSKLTIAFDAFIKQGVYPVAFEAPGSFAFSKEGLELLSRFRTVLLFDDGTIPQTMLLTGNLAYPSGHLLIAPAPSLTSGYTTSYSQALYLDFHEPLDTIEQTLDDIMRSSLSLGSLWQLSHSIYLDNIYISVANGILSNNGTKIDLKYEPYVPKTDYQYDRGFIYYMTSQIESSNRIILIFVGITITIFLMMIVSARRQMRVRLMQKPTKPLDSDHFEDENIQEGGTIDL